MNVIDKADEASRIYGHYRVTCLTPRPDRLSEFVPLWRARLAVVWLLRLAELLWRPIGAPLVGALNRLHDQLSEQMRPMQYERFVESFHNLVTTVGKNDMLDKYLKGSTYTQTLVLGLCGTGTKAAGDTQASHGGWSEVGGTNAPAYTGNRPAITMGSAAAGVSTSPSTAYSITSSGTVAGCFMNNGGSATKDNTTGVLFSAGDFSGGSQAVNNLDTLNVVWTLTLS